MLYAVFTKENPTGVYENRTALCVYSLKDIEDVFWNITAACYLGETTKVGYIDSSYGLF